MNKVVFTKKIREITRRALQLPPNKPIGPCDISCNLQSRRTLIESSDSIVPKIEVRSIEPDRQQPIIEPELCTTGPEFHELLKTHTLTEILDKYGKDVVTQDFLRELETTVQGEMDRRNLFMRYYIIAFSLIVGFVILLFNRKGLIVPSSIPLFKDLGYWIVSLTVPILGMFPIHYLFSQRIRNTGLIYYIPILIFLGMFSLLLMSGITGVDGLNKTLGATSQIGLIVGISYILYQYFGVYRQCYSNQTASDRMQWQTSLILGLSVLFVVVPAALNTYTFVSI